jgi:hypothetical protein
MTRKAEIDDVSRRYVMRRASPSGYRRAWRLAPIALAGCALMMVAAGQGTAGAQGVDTTTTSAPPTTTTTTTSAPTTTTTSTTAPPTTTTTAPPALGAPKVDPPPLVQVQTMATVGGKAGVLLTNTNGYQFPNCPQPTSEGSSTGCFYADPSNAMQWVQLVVLDRSTLSLVSNADVACDLATQKPQEYNFDSSSGGDIYSNNPNPCIKTLVGTINGLNSSDLVIAVNQPGPASAPDAQPPVGVGAALSGKFIAPFNSHNIGISAAAWFDASGNGRTLPNAVRGTFSAVGVPGWTTGGVMSMGDPNHFGAGALTTDLAVNNEALYAPFTTPSDDDTLSNVPLLHVLTQAPTANWPTESGPAMSAIGNKVGLGPDPRSQYYSSPRTDAQWQAVANTIQGLQYGDVPHTGFTQADFDAAKKELRTEIGYLISVDTYINEIAMPYSGASSTLWSTYAAIVADINNETFNGAAADASANLIDMLQTGLEIIPSDVAVGKVVKFAFDGYLVGTDMANYDSVPSTEDFSITTANLGVQLADRLNAVETEISQRWFDIIVSDYSKLKTTADCVEDQNCTVPSPNWSISRNDETGMQKLITLAQKRYAYEVLVPAKYPLALRLGGGPSSAGWPYWPAAQHLTNFCTTDPPFSDDTGDWINGQDSPKPGYQFSVWVLTYKPAKEFDAWKAASKTLFEHMFDPIDYTKGLPGVGINIDTFFAAHYHTAVAAWKGKTWDDSYSVEGGGLFGYPIGLCAWHNP